MASISSLKSLCKEVVFQNPKLDFSKDSKEGVWKIALDKMLDTQIGPKLLKTILDNPSQKFIRFEYNDKKETLGLFIPGKNGECTILRGKSKPNYYLAKDQNECKYVAEKFSDDQILFHELFHLKQSLRDGKLKDIKLIRTLPFSSRDFENRSEEETIINGENRYLEEKGYSQREGHNASAFPPFDEMLDKSKEEQKKALIEYLLNGIHKDALGLSKQFSSEEIEDIFNQLYDLNLSFRSKDFIDLMILLIEEKKINIRFNDAKYRELLIDCLIAVDTIEQFYKLEKLGAAEVIEDGFLHLIKPLAKDYFAIINYLYLISNRSLNINHKVNGLPFFFNRSIRYTLEFIEFLDSLGADFDLKDCDGDNILSYLSSYDDDFISIVEYLINEKGLDINERIFSGSPSFNSLDQLKSLEKLGEDFTKCDNQNKNILYRLDPYDDDFIPIVEYLTKEKGLKINTASTDGDLPIFHYLKKTISLNQLEALEKLGVDLMQVDAEDQNILYYLDSDNDDFIPIVEYLTKEKDFKINKTNVFGCPFFFHFNHLKKISLEQLKAIEKLGADLTIDCHFYQNTLNYFKEKKEKDLNLIEHLTNIAEKNPVANLFTFLDPSNNDFIPIVTYLTEKKGLDINTPLDFGPSFFKYCKQYMSLEQLKAFENLGADFKQLDNNGTNILCYLDPDNDNFIPIVTYLVNEKNLDINKPGIDGRPTFFIYCGKRISLERLKIFENLGADLSLHDTDGRNILFYLNSFNPDFIPIVEYLTKQKNLDINKKNQNGTPLFFEQLFFFSLGKLKLYGDLGADFSFQNGEGKNILFDLDFLDDKEFIEAVEYLIKTKNVDPLIQDKEGHYFWDNIKPPKLKLLREENLIPY